ncbi:MAG: 50S ribosomal protein L21 [Alphaproteobacteria bacterium]
MFAVVEISGKQYRVSENSTILVDKIDAEKGKNLSFENVLMVKKDEKTCSIGNPYVDKANIKAVIVDQIRDKKVIVFKKNRRKNYRRKNGHRQHYTVLKIEKITA